MFAHLVIFGDGRFHTPLIAFFAVYAGWLIVQRGRIVFAPARFGLTVLIGLSLVLVWAHEAWAAVNILRG
jgi:hypothetical protein